MYRTHFELKILTDLHQLKQTCVHKGHGQKIFLKAQDFLPCPLMGMYVSVDDKLLIFLAQNMSYALFLFYEDFL